MADHRHKRDTDARRFFRNRPKAHVVAGPLALLATLSTVGLGVLATPADVRDELLASSATPSLLDLGARDDVVVSRAGSRVEGTELEETAAARERAATQRAIRGADTKRWTTTELNLWTDSGRKAGKVGVLEAAERVLVTGRRADGRVEVVWQGKARWVTAGYLAAEKPEPEESLDVEAACTNGSSVPSGVSPNVAAVHQAVCANFPELTSYGTFRSDGEHSQGLAIDIMVSGDRGWQVAEFVRANYADLGVSYIIYAQRIWSVERGGEGWRGMSDRGSATANHYDHVHVTTY